MELLLLIYFIYKHLGECADPNAYIFTFHGVAEIEEIYAYVDICAFDQVKLIAVLFVMIVDSYLVRVPLVSHVRQGACVQ